MIADAKEKDMTSGPSGRQIFFFALPLMMGNIFQQAYTLVDTAVVGQVVGVNALAALGSSDWFNWMSLGVCSGLTQGFSILIAQQYGAKNVREMKRSLAVSLVLSLAAAVVLAALFLLLSRPVLTWMGTREEIIGDALVYVRIMFAGIPIVMTYNWLSSVLRAVGDGKTPLMAMGIASIVKYCAGHSLCGRLRSWHPRRGSSHADRPRCVPACFAPATSGKHPSCIFPGRIFSRTRPWSANYLNWGHQWLCKIRLSASAA